jgi:Dolichyl-phosphate-mannose-protein mannosyltransferase
MNKKVKRWVLIMIPLLLSAYTHLWNPLGFPSIHVDEGHYMRRAMLVLEGMGPQESAATGYPRTYDHPYFGQLFLAGALDLVGYPGVLNPDSDLSSIQLLHLAPRILMGLLAIFDTFLLFKIGERRYGTAIAVIASILFAIMPFTWVFRRITLEAILMPFLLSSILFSLYVRDSKNIHNKALLNLESKYQISNNVLILLSGMMLGLAIYTKIPAFTMIPLVGTLIFFNSGKSVRKVGIWLVPVLTVPLLWPLYSVLVGQSDLWQYWVLWQAERDPTETITFAGALMNFFKLDPLITVLGMSGIAYSAIRKDFLPLLWISPLLLFSYFIEWVQYFHLLYVFPAMCLGSAILLDNIQKVIAKYFHRRLISYSVTVTIIGVALVFTTMLISLNVNTSYFQVYATIAQEIPDTPNNKVQTNVTVIGSHFWVWDSYWITQYVLDMPHELIDPHIDRRFKEPVETNNVLFVDDPIFLKEISRKINSENLDKIKDLYNKSIEVGSFTDNVTSRETNNYPYNTLSIMISGESHPTGKVAIRKNY